MENALLITGNKRIARRRVETFASHGRLASFHVHFRVAASQQNQLGEWRVRAVWGRYQGTINIGRMRRTCGTYARMTGSVRPSARCVKSFPFSRLMPTKAKADIQSSFGAYFHCVISLTRVKFTSRTINVLAGALQTRLWWLTSIDRLHSAQDRIPWEHDKACAATQGGLHLRRRT